MADPWESYWADYYATLGVSPEAADLEIRSAYETKIAALTRDGASRRGARRSQHELRLVNQAYDVLRTPAQRQRYDAARAARARGERVRPAVAALPATTDASRGPNRTLLFGGAALVLVVVAVAAVLLVSGGGGSKASSSAAAAPTATPVAPGPDTGSPAAGGAASSVADACGGTNAESKLNKIQRTTRHNYGSAPPRVIDPAKKYTGVIQTVKGEIKVDLAAKDVPNTANNFVFLACSGFYDGLVFHRVEPNFVIQGGDPDGDGSGGPGYQVPLEISQSWRHSLGALAMARSSDPNSAGSQFYITLSPQPSLDDKYAVFGKVTAGMDVVGKIQKGDKILRIDIVEQ